MHKRPIVFFLSILLITSCARTRIKDHAEWEHFFTDNGIKDAGFILRDNNHESLHYFNKKRVTERYLPASTFKIFNSLVGLDLGTVPDESFIIRWDSVRRRPEWDRDMDMREAFKESCVPWYQELARRIGPAHMQHFLDTVKYGNMLMAGRIDTFWLNNSLRISADEQTGFLKRLYFSELPFQDRSQRIVKSIMLQEQTPGYNLYYKTGTGNAGDSTIYWVVGFAERIVNVKEPEGSMNKSDSRYYPYFFAENFEVRNSDTTKDWKKLRLEIMYKILKDYGALPQ